MVKKKLHLKKETVALLNDKAMAKIEGGGHYTIPIPIAQDGNCPHTFVAVWAYTKCFDSRGAGSEIFELCNAPDPPHSAQSACNCYG